jgi:hypothetical protein
MSDVPPLSPVPQPTIAREGWTVAMSVDYMLAQLAALKTEIYHERELRETVADKLSESLRLANTETLRRLEELNHSHKTSQENWARALPREMFVQWEDEHSKWRESVNRAMLLGASLQNSVTALESRVQVIEVMANKLTGALILLGLMGVVGVVGFLMGVARLAGLFPTS